MVQVGAPPHLATSAGFAWTQSRSFAHFYLADMPVSAASARVRSIKGTESVLSAGRTLLPSNHCFSTEWQKKREYVCPAKHMSESCEFHFLFSRLWFSHWFDWKLENIDQTVLKCFLNFCQIIKICQKQLYETLSVRIKTLNTFEIVLPYLELLLLCV